VPSLDASSIAWTSLGVVAALLAAVLLGGILLSTWTLRSTRRARLVGSSALPSRGLGRAYAFVIAVTVGVFYLVTPVVIVATIGGAIALLWYALSEGSFNVKLILFLGALVLITLFAAISGLIALVRRVHDDPGVRLDLATAPRLRALLDEVAAQIGTRPIDTVFLTPMGDLAVFERRGERCLILGVGLLDGFSLRGFRAVLAHEYGHFANRDTAGGTQALAVRRSLEGMLATLRDPRQSESLMDFLNPTWLFLSGFRSVFLRVSQGASRLQEYLADQWAAVAYGPDAFEEGFRHVVRNAARSELAFHATLEESIRLQRPIHNLFRARPAALETVDFDVVVQEELERPAGPYDSHPSPLERFEWVRAVAEERGVGSPARCLDDAWSLFSDRDATERSVTEQVLEGFPLLVTGRAGVEPSRVRGWDEPPDASPNDDAKESPSTSGPMGVGPTSPTSGLTSGLTTPDPSVSDAPSTPTDACCPAPGGIAPLWRGEPPTGAAS
jgi:Zn-dependent protease with chaperone function